MQEKYAFMQKKCKKIWSCQKKAVLLHPLSFEEQGAIAQLVEQRTENPCVTGSIPVGTTVKRLTRASFFVPKIKLILLFYIKVLRIQKKCSIFAANFNIVKP